MKARGERKQPQTFYIFDGVGKQVIGLVNRTLGCTYRALSMHYFGGSSAGMKALATMNDPSFSR